MAGHKKTGKRRVESAASVVPEQNCEDAIRERAYELYVERGRINGSAEEDWLRAEAEVLTRRRGATPGGAA